MPLFHQIIFFGVKANALILCLLILPGCSQKTVDPKDIGNLQAACESIKSKDGKAACLNSLINLAGKEPIDAMPKRSVPGIATEAITFKGIPFDQPNQLENLMTLCAETKRNLEHKILGDKIESKCKSPSNGYLWFQVSYGPMDQAGMAFKVNDTGALTKVSLPLERQQVSPLVAVLTQKYGSAKIEEDEIRNGIGNIFDRQIFSWSDQKGNIMIVHSRHRKVDEGYFEIKSAAEVLNDANKIAETISSGKERL